MEFYATKFIDNFTGMSNGENYEIQEWKKGRKGAVVKSSKQRDPTDGVGVSDVLQSSFSVMHSDIDNSVLEPGDEAKMFDWAPKRNILAYL